jgi:type IV pilus assembly protein PilC
MGLLSAQISTRDLVPLCRQLATSYDAGIPILRSIALVRENARDAKTREVLLHMENSITRGASLGEAAAAQSKHLPVFLIQLLDAGEHGGRLDVMLRDLANYYEDRQRMTRQVIGEMIFPGLQLIAAWFLGTFALGLVRQLNFDFNINRYLGQYIAFQISALTIFGILAVVAILLARAGTWKYIWGWAANKIWPFSNVTQKFALARFFRSFALLVGSGLNIKQCIRGAAATTANPYIEKDLLQAIPIVSDGATLVQAFAPVRCLTRTAREMLMVGEESGRLDVSLNKVAEYHLAEATAALQAAGRILRVMLTLGMGLLVGYIVISFYSSYFSFLDSI